MMERFPKKPVSKNRFGRLLDAVAGYCFSHSAHLIRVLLWTCIAAGVLFAALNVLFGPLNQDEGWYLYAAREIARGRLPYRDFFFTQGPVMPAAYALFAWVWQPFGILGGRCFTALLGLLATFLFAETAANCVRRQHGREVRLIVWALSACNLYHSYFTVIPKTYALGSCLLAAGFLFLSITHPRPPTPESRRLFVIKGWAAFLSGLMFALAGGARTSLALPLAVVGLWLLVKRNRVGAFNWLYFGFGGALGLLCVYAPPLLFARESFFFAQDFHTRRDAGANGLFLMIGAVARLCRYYPLTGLLGLYFMLRKVIERPHTDSSPGYRAPLSSLWIWCFAVIFTVQLLMPVPYDDYQVPVMGLGAMILAICCVSVKENARRFRLISGTAILALLFFSISSPMVQRWFFITQDCFWSKIRTTPSVVELRSIAAELRQRVEAGDAPRLILTMDTYLAVETGFDVPRGMEMGPFCYFPELPTEAAEKFHVHNTETFLNLIRSTPAPVAALSGYAFAIGSPVMTDMRITPERDRLVTAVDDRYRPIFSIDDFGQNHTRLDVFTLRYPPEAEP